MKMNHHTTWDKVIYGLVYPGFLGSMLYEFVPTDATKITVDFYLYSADNILRYGIIIFYFLDYMHLYGDMESVLLNPKHKDLIYFICDIVSCIGYLAAFIAIKFGDYNMTIIVFGSVPILFGIYKRKNPKDRLFFSVYSIITIAIAVYALFSAMITWLPSFSKNHTSIFLVFVNVLIYSFYIFKYYERESRQIDEQIYSSNKLV